ncbi:hypothetical protein BDR26DRAFT_879780 [Obelidium mucronatum]|nr:hypothetical protein BDR26DRAFT_879780 [Obelidium mucronatum]
MQFKGPGGFDLLDDPTPSPMIQLYFSTEFTTPSGPSPSLGTCDDTPDVILAPSIFSWTNISPPNSPKLAFACSESAKICQLYVPPLQVLKSHRESETSATTQIELHRRFSPPATPPSELQTIQHTITTSMTKKRHACTWEGCSKSFSKPNLLQTHLNIHNHIKPHKCIACSTEFARKHDLLRHSRHVHQLNL